LTIYFVSAITASGKFRGTITFYFDHTLLTAVLFSRNCWTWQRRAESRHAALFMVQHDRTRRMRDLGFVVLAFCFLCSFSFPIHASDHVGRVPTW